MFSTPNVSSGGAATSFFNPLGQQQQNIGASNANPSNPLGALQPNNNQQYSFANPTGLFSQPSGQNPVISNPQLQPQQQPQQQQNTIDISLIRGKIALIQSLKREVS
jgi:hypothetical protein